MLAERMLAELTAVSGGMSAGRGGSFSVSSTVEPDAIVLRPKMAQTPKYVLRSIFTVPKKTV